MRPSQRQPAALAAEQHELRHGPSEERELNERRLVKRRVINSPEQTYVATHLLPPSPLLAARPTRKAHKTAAAPATPALAAAAASIAVTPAAASERKKAGAARKGKAAARRKPEPPTPAPQDSRDETSNRLPELDEWRRIEEEAASALDTPRPRRTPKPMRAAMYSPPAFTPQAKRKESPVVAAAAAKKAPASAKRGRATPSATPRRKPKKDA